MHNLLVRQLSRLGIQPNSKPTNEQWEKLLERIDKSYTEADQDRYLLERSMEISSREMLELNEKLEYAQHIANLGYWHYEIESKKIMWSKEMFRIFGIEHGNKIPTYEELMNTMSFEDRNALQGLMNHAMEEGIDYEFETQIKTFNNKEKWCYFYGKPTLHTLSGDKKVQMITGIALDITSRKQSELKVVELNKQVVASARRAGMSEVAVSVLHNIGNILNSVNISIEYIQKCLQESEVNNIISAIKIINEHSHDLAQFIKEDPKGQLLPNYFVHVEKEFAKSNQNIFNEISRLVESVNHIKDIVAIQNSLSGTTQILEKTTINQVIDSAISLNCKSFDKYGIKLQKNYQETIEIETDKNKVIQILINLIQNAKDALLVADPNINKEIMISIKHDKQNKYIDIDVSDNGIGISTENLTRIFNFGFSTKKTGHGFGLHSSALLAKELGGELRVESQGIGQGAHFVLRLATGSVKEGRRAHA